MGDLVGDVIGGFFQKEAAEEIAKAQEKMFKQQRKALEDASELLRSGYRGQVEAAKTGDFEGLFGLSDIFGGKPDVAAFTPVSLAGSQMEAIRSNLASLPQAQQLASALSGGFTGDALTRARSIIPDFDEAQALQSQQALEFMQGRIPQDVAESVASARAELSGLGGIFGGDRNLVARDLGLTSLDLQGRGASLFQNIIGQAGQLSPTSGLANAAAFSVSPAQQSSLDFQQAMIDQGQRQNALNIGAAPDPAAGQLFQAGLANLGGRASTLAGVAGLVPNTAATAGMGNMILGQAIGSGVGGAINAFGQGFQSQPDAGFFNRLGSGFGNMFFGT